MNSQRRRFLKTAVAVVTGASAMPLLGGCTSLGRGDMKPAFPASDLPPELQEILRLAALAPSSHNTQPWQVEIQNERHLAITADPARALNVIDPKHREVFLSMGAFLENLVQAAGAVGLDAELATMDRERSDHWQADVTLRNSTATPYPIERLKRRRTLRGGYESREIGASQLKRLELESRTELKYLPRGSREASFLSEVTLAAFEQQTASDPAQEELSRWIRFSNSEAERHRDGITPSMMEIEGIGNWIVRHFYDSDDVLKPSFRARGNENTANQVKQGAGWLLITSPGETPAALIEAGRSYERLALLVREHGMALHPMSQALEEKPWSTELLGNLGLTQPVQFILRCGFVNRYPEPVSIRRPVAWFANDMSRLGGVGCGKHGCERIEAGATCLSSNT